MNGLWRGSDGKDESMSPADASRSAVGEDTTVLPSLDVSTSLVGSEDGDSIESSESSPSSLEAANLEIKSIILSGVISKSGFALATASSCLFSASSRRVIPFLVQKELRIGRMAFAGTIGVDGSSGDEVEDGCSKKSVLSWD
jgi:hypothetical protein